MLARIFSPAKNAMQSGKAGEGKWVLEFAAERAKKIEPLMGWTGSGDVRGQIKLKFDSKDDAVAYAERNGLAYQVIEPKVRSRKSKTYADNFKYGRIGLWTH